jgi:hypothetical protein
MILANLLRGKPYKIRALEEIQFKGILSSYFALTYTLSLKNGSFLAKFSSLQKLKVAIYKGFVILGRQKQAKNRGRNCLFFEN